MFEFIDHNYRQAIIALTMHHRRPKMIIAGLVVFLTFALVITIMLLEKGLLILISLPISALITLGYLYFMQKKFKKQLSMTRIKIKQVKITIDQSNIYTDTTFNDNKVVHSEINLDKIIKIIETKDYYYLYDQPISAIVISKKAITTNNISKFHEFISRKFKVKYVKG
jgi:hypothetical protein